MQKRAILDNIASLQSEILQNAMDPSHPPRLLPVTKTQSIDAMRVLLDCGLTTVGENRVQEIVEKYPQAGSDFSFHLIGRLQTNKIKYIIGRVCMVQALDRLALAQALDVRTQAAGLRMPVLVEVNIGGESQKAGISPGEVVSFVRTVARFGGIQIRGLMAVMPMAGNPEALRPLFRRMRALFLHLRELAIDGTAMDELSMGMSGDWQIAAQEGATMLRIGSAIFGDRPPKA